MRMKKFQTSWYFTAAWCLCSRFIGFKLLVQLFIVVQQVIVVDGAISRCCSPASRINVFTVLTTIPVDLGVIWLAKRFSSD